MKIIILGMHRSGTSLASGLLSLSGVHFGEEDEFIQTNDENPKGFWERKDIRQLNDLLLHKMDCDWSEISNLYKKEIPEKTISDFNSQTHNIITKLQQESKSGVIGLKEPRLCLLMPYWQHLIDENDFFLLVYRDPKEIAISLENRNSIPEEVSNYLTERYLGCAINAINNRPHSIVSYEDLIDNPIQSTVNIVNAINARGQRLTTPNVDKLIEYSSKDLYRSRNKGGSFKIRKSLEQIYLCLSRGEIPLTQSTEIPVPKAVLEYEHSKRFEEYHKSARLIQSLKKSTHERSKIEQQLQTSLAETEKQQILEHHSLLFSQAQQNVLKRKLVELELAISEANQELQIKSAQLAESRKKAENILKEARPLAALSLSITERHGLLFSSSTWRITEKFIRFALSPQNLGKGPTVLDEINEHIERIQKWNTEEQWILKPVSSTANTEIQSSDDRVDESLSENSEQESRYEGEVTNNFELNVLGNKDQPVKVGFVVTEDTATTSAGDYFTAMEFANALETELGWDCGYLPERGPNDWYDVSDLDVLFVLLDKYDVTRIHGHSKPVLKIAWVRNWVDRWTIRPWFQGFDLILCTSNIASRFIVEQTGKAAKILKIATNPERFKPSDTVCADFQSDYCFTGSYWGAPRHIESLDPSRLPFKFALFGSGWENHQQFADCYKGHLSYDQLPVAYANTKVLVDDANHATKPWASVNSRVFDALASGTLVITNGIEGARETFGDLLPTYSSEQNLRKLLHNLLNRPEEYAERLQKLHDLVVDQHSYHNRAAELRNVLEREFDAKTRIAIKLPISSTSSESKGHYFHFGKNLAKALEATGHAVRLDFQSEWYSKPYAPDDVVIALHGRLSYKPENAHLNLLWVIDHPSEIKREQLQQYDCLFVASREFTEELNATVASQVMPLLQCTDSERFLPKEGRRRLENVVFIGDAGSGEHRILNDAITSGIKPTLVGKDWQSLDNDCFIAGECVDHESLPELYATSSVVLCQHDPDMVEHGFISNQVFEVVASGAIPICENVKGIKEVFGDLVYVYTDGADDLGEQVKMALSESAEMMKKRLNRAAEVANNHSFGARAEIIDSAIRGAHKQTVT